MFESLKKKLAGWLGTSKSEKEEKPIKTDKKAAKSKKAEKKQKETKKRVKSDTESERKVSGEMIEDIKKETKTSEISAVPQIDDSEVEEIKEESKVEVETEEKQGFFSRLINKISTSKLTQEQFDELFMELEITLLENNVALEVVDKIKENLSKGLVDKQFKKSEAEEKILSALKESILSVLIEPPNLLSQIKSKEGPFVILFFGINGSGKTTSIAKLAHKLKEEKISCVLAAGDTFRAASIEQLQTHGKRLGIEVISSQYGADPSSVAFDAIAYAKKHNIKVVLIDTAGRMYTKSNLLKEMEKVVRVTQPDLKIFVGESITGNDAVEQAKTFNEIIGIDGIILSKADVDEKAGTILSVSQVTNKPIYFLGVGQEYKDLEPFTKKTVLKNLGID